MNVVDANILLYAVNESAEKHVLSRSWLDGALNGSEAVGFSWVVLLAFVRLATKVGLFPSPLPVEDAVQRVQEWLAQPPSTVLEPTSRHVAVFAGLLRQTGTGGNLVNDAHLAALAIEHDGTVVTFDGDFDRFPGVRWHPPRD